MTLQKTNLNDVWVKIPNNNQLDNLHLLKKYIDSHKLGRDFRDEFPREIDPNEISKYSYKPNQIYQFDLSMDLHYNGCAQFIVDSEKIILKPFYSLQQYSVNQREIIADDFLNFLIENNIDIVND